MRNYGLRPVEPELIENSDLLWTIVPVGANGSAEKNHEVEMRRNNGENVTSDLDEKTSIYKYEMKIYRAPQGMLIWDALDKGDLIQVGGKSYYPGTLPEFDKNGRLLLNASNFGWEGSHLYDNGGNVMIDRDGQVIADYGYSGYLYPADTNGLYFKEIYTTRSSGGHPKPQYRKFNFIDADGRPVLPKDVIRSDEPVLHRFNLSKYGAQSYVFDQGKPESNERPMYFGDAVDLLTIDQNMEYPLISDRDKFECLKEIINFPKQYAGILARLENDRNRKKITVTEYIVECNRLLSTLKKFGEYQKEFISEEDIEYISSKDEGM